MPFDRSVSLDLNRILQGWKTVLFCTAAGIALAAVLLLTVTPGQEVSARILVEARSLSFDSGEKRQHDKEFLPTQAEILQSPAIIASALQSISQPDGPAPTPEQCARIGKDLRVDPLAGTSILLVRYSDQSPDRAVGVVNGLISGYQNHLLTTERQQHDEMIRALKSQEGEFRRELDQLQTEYAELNLRAAESPHHSEDASNRMIAGLDESLSQIQLKVLELENAADRIERRFADRSDPSAARSVGMPTSLRTSPLSEMPVMADSILNELSQLASGGLIEIINPSALSERLTAARLTAAQFEGTLGPKHPERQAAEEMVRRAETEQHQLVVQAPLLVTQALEQLRSQQEMLQQRYDALVAATRQEQMTVLLESQKQKDIERVRASLDENHTRLQAWQVSAQAVEAGHGSVAVSVLEAPRAAERSFAANPLIVCGIGGITGLLSGIVLLTAMPLLRALLPMTAAAVPTTASA